MKAARRSVTKFIPDSRGTLSLGCPGCEFFARCDGLRDDSHRVSCFDECPGRCKQGCGNACPKNPDFLRRVKEVNGLAFDDIAYAPLAPLVDLPFYVPLLDHRSLFDSDLALDIVAIPLRRLIDVRRRASSYENAEALKRAFRLPDAARVLALGVAKDVPLEHFWGMSQQIRVLNELHRLNLHGVTAPNFSSFRDQPRTEDLVNQKRMLLSAYRLQSVGIPTAIHWGIFQPKDFEYHVDFLREHIEFDTISIEFGSGFRSKLAAEFFLRDMEKAIGKIGRPMRLISKGGLRYLPMLREAFSRMTLVDSVPFHTTLSRHKLVLGNDGRLLKVATPTHNKTELLELFQENVRVRSDFTSKFLGVD